MNTDQVEMWLRRRVRSSAGRRVLLAVGAFAAGAVILLMTHWIVYGVIFFGFHWIIPLFHSIRWWASLVFVILLFVGNARTSREYLTEYSFTTGTASDTPVSFYVPGLGVASNINPLAPDTIRSHVKMITDVLYTGPRVVVWGIRSIQKAYHLAKLDVSACAAVMTLLFAAGQKVSFVDIAAKLPSLNISKVFTELGYIDGVMFLTAEPPGLTLESAMRKELLSAS